MSKPETERSDDELLSALMDDELSVDEELHVLERLHDDPALQARWARFHAARAALDEGPGHMSPGFAGRVGRAREAEPAVLAPRRVRRPLPTWVRPVAGLAVAASVALVAIGALTLLRGPSPEGPPVTVATQSPPAVNRDEGLARVAVSTVDGASPAQVAAQRQRLMLYLVSHSEYADAGEIPTVIPYGRLGGLNAGQ
ncbi:MAG: sigma-E factor negative regulatory protein [Halofilum sp. (in: g-proteobacteria)]|nr:sigma-E factor negative regulatory protein [Halofilum sp. (in: g-proteobacteria)]